MLNYVPQRAFEAQPVVHFILSALHMITLQQQILVTKEERESDQTDLQTVPNWFYLLNIIRKFEHFPLT